MADPLTVDELLAQPFTIHALNAYDHIGLTVMADYLDLKPPQLQKIIRGMHHRLVGQLAGGGIDYSTLRSALTPQRGRYEVAFLFDSTAVSSNWYGYEISKVWLSALREHGPEKTAIRCGDIMHLPPEFVWQKLDETLVRHRPFPRLSPQLYYAVYLTNLSSNQLRDLDAAMRSVSSAYLGYIDCSVWNPLKSGMLLPQFGLRTGQVFITSCDDSGHANQVGYPLEEFGFDALGIDDDLYGPLLTHRCDNGIPEWADQDSVVALSVLGGSWWPVSEVNLTVDDSRFRYLIEKHGPSLEAAGLSELDPALFSNAIKSKIANSLIFNLRFTAGSRDGIIAPEIDAMMFTVQVEFLGPDGTARRFQVGVKYLAASHTAELVTFF